MSEKTKVNHLTPSQLFKLRHACDPIVEAFGQCYLVGSAIKKPDFRDVDIRCILADNEFDAIFAPIPEDATNPYYHARWSLLSNALSDWLSDTTGLPVDFQFQKRSIANQKFDGERQRVGGMHVSHGDARE